MSLLLGTPDGSQQTNTLPWGQVCWIPSGTGSPQQKLKTRLSSSDHPHVEEEGMADYSTLKFSYQVKPLYLDTAIIWLLLRNGIFPAISVNKDVTVISHRSPPV